MLVESLFDQQRIRRVIFYKQDGDRLRFTAWLARLMLRRES
jgi:hypothetical protein